MMSLAALPLLPGSAHALPQLQLTIDGGSYDPYTESTITYDRQFDLYALLDKKKKSDLNQTYYISASITPKPGAPELPVTSLGSFTFAGQTVDLTGGAEVEFGTPPGLPTHGEFPAYYEEFAFTFSGDRADAFNAETFTPQGALDAGCTKDCLYFELFSVDATQLNPTYTLHFDLYTKTNDGEVAKFAPFSHDAEMRASLTNGGGDDGNPVPEPNTPALLVIALAAMKLARMRKSASTPLPAIAA